MGLALRRRASSDSRVFPDVVDRPRRIVRESRKSRSHVESLLASSRTPREVRSLACLLSLLACLLLGARSWKASISVRTAQKRIPSRPRARAEKNQRSMSTSIVIDDRCARWKIFSFSFFNSTIIIYVNANNHYS